MHVKHQQEPLFGFFFVGLSTFCKGSHHTGFRDMGLTSMVLIELSPVVVMALMAPFTASYALAPASV